MTIETLVTVWCDGDRCEAYTDGRTLAEAFRDASAEGWRLAYRNHLCPDCRPAETARPTAF